MLTERFTFPGQDGSARIACLDWPDDAPLTTALMAHCFSCGADAPADRRITARLTRLGMAVLRIDIPALGPVDYEVDSAFPTGTVADLEAAAGALAARGLSVDLLIGHSLGGSVVLRAAHLIPSVKGVVTIGAPFEPAPILRRFDDRQKMVARTGPEEPDLGEKSAGIGRGIVGGSAGADIGQTVATLETALLVLHAPRDEVVGIDNALRIFGQARHPKSFVTLDNADHLITRPADADHAAGVIAAWAARHLDLRRPAPPIGAPEGVTRVTEVAADGLAQDIVASGGQHHLTADEPAAYGGTDRGLSPYQLLAASLGACTSMTLRMYARRRGWPLDSVSVDVTHDRMHAQDAPSASGERIDRFRREVWLRGPLDARQRARLMEIADRCPVHRTLEAGATVETVLHGQSETRTPSAA